MSDNYNASTYGDCRAEDYDRIHGLSDYETNGAVDAVAGLAKLMGPESRVLELGIGTGRIALPLAARGIGVDGLDCSERILAQLRARPGSESIGIHQGDFARFSTGGARYSVVYAVFSTFLALLTQDEQLACFRSVADALAPGGHFLIEAMLLPSAVPPAATRFLNDSTAQLELSSWDPFTQILTRFDVVFFEGGGVRTYPAKMRIAPPSELDLMARLADLELAARYGNWYESPYTPESVRHISIYRKPVRT